MAPTTRLTLFALTLPLAGLLACGGGSSSTPAAPSQVVPALTKVTTLSGLNGVSATVDGPLGTASFVTVHAPGTGAGTVTSLEA